MRTARAEVTDRMPIGGQRHPRANRDEYVAHDNQHRPHRARTLRPPDSAAAIPAAITGLAAAPIRRRKVFGGLIHKHQRAA